MIGNLHGGLCWWTWFLFFANFSVLLHFSLVPCIVIEIKHSHFSYHASVVLHLTFPPTIVFMTFALYEVFLSFIRFTHWTIFLLNLRHMFNDDYILVVFLLLSSLMVCMRVSILLKHLYESTWLFFIYCWWFAYIIGTWFCLTFSGFHFSHAAKKINKHGNCVTFWHI